MSSVIGLIVLITLAALLTRRRQRAPPQILGQDKPVGKPQRLPKQLDLTNREHAHLVDDIRERYSAVLMRQDGEFKGCLYRPATMLPYPAPDIERALQSLLSVAEGKVKSPYFPASIFGTEAAAETIGVCLLHLSEFIDVPAADLPREPAANSVYVVSFQEELAKGATVADARNQAAAAAAVITEVRAKRRTT